MVFIQLNPASSTSKIMGKINTYRGIEVIPLDTNSNLSRFGSRVKHASGDTPRMHRFAYPADPLLVTRVQQYLEENVDQTYIDINTMAEELQRAYKEYSKRKRSAFRGAVKKAYSVVMHSYGHSDPQHSSSEDLSEDSQGEEEAGFHNNSLNSQLAEMYGHNLPKGPVDSNELIDISSDDTNDSEPAKKKIAREPSTSKKTDLPLPPPLQEAQSSSNIRGKKRKAENEVPTAAKKKLYNIPKESFKDVGGLDNVLEQVCKLLVHMKHPQIYRTIGISPPRGFLLHGPPGCGKTLLCRAIAGELKIPLLQTTATELIGGISGESESRIRNMFNIALLSAPCIFFIDEIDAIAGNRQNAQKDMERRIVAQLVSSLDELDAHERGDQILVIGATNRLDSIDPAIRRAGRFDREICVGIPDAQARQKILTVLTSNLRLNKNFDFKTIAESTPGFVGADLLAATREAALLAAYRMFSELREKQRLIELQKQEERIREKALADEDSKSEVDVVDVESSDKLDDEKPDNIPTTSNDNAVVIIDDDVKEKSVTTNGDTVIAVDKEQVVEPCKTVLQELLMLLHSKVALSDENLRSVCITEDDFRTALKTVQPSLKREGFATVPDTTWADVGSLAGLKEELKMSLLGPVRHGELFKKLGLTTPSGILLWGPPGCGKTLVAKALANEGGINFLSVKGPELLNMYVGESERAVRVCFERARNSAPCVIFFDELDALCPKRSDNGEGGASMRVVNQMLTEMDGIEGRQGVFILAATNRPDIIDPAVLRPGRLDKVLYVDLPSGCDRVDILRTITKNGQKPLLAPDVDLEQIGMSSEFAGYTGADLAAIVREASVEAFREHMLSGDPQQTLMVSNEHFKRATAKVRPSVSEKDRKHYEKLKQLYGPKYLADVEEMEYS